jgi:hypothetical protein
MTSAGRTNFFLTMAAVAGLCTAGTAQGAAPSNSLELCEQRVESAVLSDKIRDSATSPIRDVTPDDLARLRRVMRSQCMLSARELSIYWDGKTEAERSAFFSNYDSISSAITAEIFESIFPNRQAVYTYDNFLRSAMAFPMLCAEEGESVEACKREFATMFAHWLQETSGLQYLWEGPDGACRYGGCSSYVYDDAYFYNEESVKANPDPGYQYWGRGPKQLSYNSNYGRFSWGFLSASTSNLAFLERPGLLLDDAYIDQSFVSAFWFYMTPISLKPSMHEIVAGLWTPNAVDEAAGISPGFGATIDVINGALECNKPTPQTAANRIAFYRGGVAQGQPTEGTLAAFGLAPLPGEILDCETMGPFQVGGAGAYPLYFNLNPWSQCELFVNESLFTVFEQSPMHVLGNRLCENGHDCCSRIQPKLPETMLLPPLALNEFVKWMGGTPVDIKANGSDSVLRVSVSDTVTLQLDVDAEGTLERGELVDFGLAALDLDDGSWLVYQPDDGNWSRMMNLQASCQCVLLPLDPEIDLVRVEHPPAGAYRVYLGFDTDANGTVDQDSLRHDSVDVIVTTIVTP